MHSLPGQIRVVLIHIDLTFEIRRIWRAQVLDSLKLIVALVVVDVVVVVHHSQCQ